MKFPFSFYKTGLSLLVPLLLAGVLASCDPFVDAPPARRLELVREGLKGNDQEFILGIARDAKRVAVLLDAHPGAAWYLGLRLLDLQVWEEARSLFVQQLKGSDTDFAALAVEGWVKAAVKTPEGRALLARDGKALKDGLDASSPFAESSLAVLEPAWLDALDEKGEAEILQAEALAMRETRIGRGIKILPRRPLGESGLESWLLYHLSRSRKADKTEDSRLPAGLEALVAYDLAHEAKSGQMKAGSLHEKEFARYLSRGMVTFLQAKKDLVAGRPGQALTGYREVAAGLDSMRQEFDLPLVRLAGREALIKDVYTAARQGNERKLGTQVLQSLAAWFDREEPALGAYAHELAGRLLLERTSWKAARTELGKALEVELHPDDRRRVVWYLIQSWLDEAEEHKGRITGEDKLLKALLLADGDSYFSDVLDEVMATLARQGKFDLLAKWFDQGLARMDRPLGFRLAWILANEKEDKPAGKGKKAPGHPYTDYLLTQTESIYYHALASWKRDREPLFESFLGPAASGPGESVPLEDAEAATDGPASPAVPASPVSSSSPAEPEVLTENGKPADSPLPPPGDTSPGARIAKVARGFGVLGIPADSFRFVWQWRKSVDDGIIYDLMESLEDEGRYRDALRLGDSLRLRKGHPVDTRQLRLLYPLALEGEMDESLTNLGIPREIWFSLVRTESAFDAAAVSRVGAQGLSQLMPDTAKETAARHGIKGNPADPRVNLRIGALYLNDQFRYFRSWPLALTAYNAGPGNAADWKKSSWGSRPWVLAERMPFAETRNYVRRILESAFVYHWIYGGGKDMEAFVKDLVSRH